jgi:hypothetical protein
MAGITLADAEAKLQLWMTAETSLATSQSYTIEDGSGNRRQLTRADLSEVRKAIEYWNSKVVGLTRAAGRRSNSRYLVN